MRSPIISSSKTGRAVDKTSQYYCRMTGSGVDAWLGRSRIAGACIAMLAWVFAGAPADVVADNSQRGGDCSVAARIVVCEPQDKAKDAKAKDKITKDKSTKDQSAKEKDKA